MDALCEYIARVGKACFVVLVWQAHAYFEAGNQKQELTLRAVRMVPRIFRKAMR